ncbi:unnamed protein product [Boreogadus saida]
MGLSRELALKMSTMQQSAWAPPTFPTGHLRALLELDPFQGPNAPPVPPPWHRVTGTWHAFGASAPTTPRLLWRPPSPVSPAGSCLKRGSSSGIFFSPSVDLAEAIDLFRAGGPDLDDDGGIINVDDVASLDDVFGDSASGFPAPGLQPPPSSNVRDRAGWPISSGRSWVRRRPSRGFPCRPRLSPPYLTICRASAFAPHLLPDGLPSAPCSRLCSTCSLLPVGTLKALVKSFTDFTNVEGCADTQARGIPLACSLPWQRFSVRAPDGALTKSRCPPTASRDRLSA